MKITREEFKEYVNLYQEAWQEFDKYADIIDSDFLDGLIFPAFNWIDEKLELKDENIGSLVFEYVANGGLSMGEREEDGTIRDYWVSDLDILYDVLIKGGLHYEA